MTDIMEKPNTIDSNHRDPGSGSSKPAGQADGSPSRTDGPDGPGSHDDSVPASGDGEGGGAPEPTAAEKELRRKITEQSEAIANLRTVADALNTHEDLREELLRRERGEGNGNDPEFAELEKEIDDVLNEKSAAMMKKIMKRTLEIAERRAESKVKPLFSQVQRSAATVDFVRGLRQDGLDAELMEDPDFQDHLKELAGTYRSFGRSMRDDPLAAAKMAASTWKERTGRKIDYVRERQRTQDAKDSSLNARGSSPSKAASSEKIDVPMSSGMRGVLDAIKRGVPPDKIRRTRG